MSSTQRRNRSGASNKNEDDMTKMKQAVYAICAGAFLTLPGMAWTQTPEKAPPVKNAPAPAEPGKGKPADAKAAPPPAPRATGAVPVLSFLPPAPGAPIRREGGATRGVVGDARELALSVIAPEQAGWSSREQPELYWFTSRSVSNAIQLTINPASGNAIDPLYEGPITASADGGIQVISLQKLGVKLMPNTDYEWSVSLVTDSKSPSRDLVASGRIRFAPLSVEGRVSMDRMNETEQAERLARGGYWYDLVQLMRHRFPGSAAEIGLYESAGLSRIARFLKAGS